MLFILRLDFLQHETYSKKEILYSIVKARGTYSYIHKILINIKKALKSK